MEDLKAITFKTVITDQQHGQLVAEERCSFLHTACDHSLFRYELLPLYRPGNITNQLDILFYHPASLYDVKSRSSFSCNNVSIRPALATRSSIKIKNES